jgi:DNA-binding GntR family transcriptional regulator
MQHQSDAPRENPEAPLSPLQRRVAARIAERLRAPGDAGGMPLTELQLAADLGVSRTPVRAALGWLVRQGLLQHRPGIGFVGGSAAPHAPLDLPTAADDAERLFVAVARERNAGRLPGDVSEADLMRRFEVTRPTLLRVLNRLAEIGMVERKSGHGWLFAPSAYDEAAQRESYRFRTLIEPAGLREPGFVLPDGWIATMRRRHEQMLAQPWHDGAAVELFEMNAQFHEGLAAASGNRYFLMAVQQQNRLRRFVNYDWGLGAERMVVSCSEHLEMLDRIAAGDHEVAAALMTRHLDKASRIGRTATPE